MTLIADAGIDAREYQTHLKSLMFLCGFVLCCIAVAIWWLRR
jgi:hypothetical protein